MEKNCLNSLRTVIIKNKPVVNNEASTVKQRINDSNDDNAAITTNVANADGKT